MEQKEFENYVIYIFLLLFFAEQFPFDVDTKKKHQSPHIPWESRTSMELMGIPIDSMSNITSPSLPPEE